MSAVVGLGLLGVGAGSTAARLLDGDAWLANARTGTVSLANGYSGKVSAAVRTGLQAGDPFTVVQRPNGAYVVDDRTGQLVRIDGTSLQSSRSATAAAGLGGPNLDLVAGGGRTYVMDRATGVVQPLDPRTLRPDGPRIDLRSAISQGVADGHGNLWAALPGEGAVVEIAGARVVGTHPVGQHNDAVSVGVTSTCVVAVDASSGVATCLTGSGTTVHIPGGATQVPLVAASTSSPDLVSVEGSRATDIDTQTGTWRTSSLPAGARVTQAVVNANQAYLLNRSSQQVVDINLDSGTLGAPFSAPGGTTDLSEGGGLAFANNANGPQAVAVAPDGTQTPIQKYDPRAPYAGLGPSTSPASGAAQTVAGSAQAAPADAQPSQGQQGDTTAGGSLGTSALPSGPATATGPSALPSVSAQAASPSVSSPADSPPTQDPSPSASSPASPLTSLPPQKSPTTPPTTARTPASSGPPPTTPPTTARTPASSGPPPTTPPTTTPPPQSPRAPSIPGQPAGLVVTGGNQAVTATWKPPTGGGPVAAYNVYDQTGHQQLGVTSTSATFTGLSNGTQDCVKVQAVSSAGQAGPFASACATPASASPAPPASVHASLNGTTATVTWTPPAPSPAYPAPANYLVTSSGGAPQTVPASTATFTNLSAGTTYTFTVASLTASGTASATAASNPVTPIGAPSLPVSLTLVPSTTSISVAFGAPTSDGGSPISHYTITITEAGGGSASTHVVASPGTYAEAASTQGATYNVSVTATNGGGLTSPPSSDSATTTFATRNLYLCYRAPSTVAGAPPEDYMLSQQSNCTEPPYAPFSYQGVSFPVAVDQVAGSTTLWRCYTTAGHHMEMTDAADCGPDAASSGDQPNPMGFVWLSPGPGHNLHITELFNSSGMEVCVPDANVGAWMARGFTSNQGGFYAAG